MLEVGTLRALFRHLQVWQALFEDEGVDTLVDTEGHEWHLTDLEYLYEEAQALPPRQYQAIKFCLVENMLEQEVAVMMGTSPSNPVASYATEGLKNLIKWIEEGRLSRFRIDPSQEVA